MGSLILLSLSSIGIIRMSCFSLFLFIATYERKGTKWLRIFSWQQNLPRLDLMFTTIGFGIYSNPQSLLIFVFPSLKVISFRSEASNYTLTL